MKERHFQYPKVVETTPKLDQKQSGRDTFIDDLAPKSKIPLVKRKRA